LPLLGGSRERLAEEPTRVGFRRLEASDLPMIHRWPHIPHVARWWYEDTGPYEKVARHYSAYIEGEEPFEPYLILHDGRPVGYVQWYRVSEDEEYGELVGIEDAAGIDLFIGERDLLYRELGPLVIRRFIEDIVFGEESVETCIIDPEPENRAAIRAYEKVGFSYSKSADTSGGPVNFMKLRRGESLV
jgi:RimJ/RimL family protein N-acetyltransferase